MWFGSPASMRAQTPPQPRPQEQMTMASVSTTPAGDPGATADGTGAAPNGGAALKGGTAQDNASAIRDLFSGARTAFRDIVLLNAAAALIVAEKTATLSEGVEEAADAIDTGRAARILEEARTASRVTAR